MEGIRGGLAFVLMLAVALVGCRVADPESDATARADAYLTALRSAPDHGWSLLLNGGEAYGGRDAYLAELDGLELGSVAGSAVDARCDDGVCEVWYLLDGDGVGSRAFIGAVMLTDPKPVLGSNAIISVVQRAPWDTGIVAWLNR
jgi:hypothetical protein